MKLLNLDLDVTTTEQRRKVLEEFAEFTLDNNLEEAMDVIQSLWTWMNMVYTKLELDEGFEAHINKLEGRNYRIEKYLELKELSNDK